MHLKLILSFSLILTFFHCQTQNTKTYWIIDNIYNEKNEALIGQKGVKYYYEQLLYNEQLQFIKKGDILHFLSPHSIQISIDSLRNFDQLRVENGKYFDVENYKFKGKTFTVKYKNYAMGATPDDYKMVFKKIEEKEFYEHLKAKELEQERIILEMKDLKHRLLVNNPIKIKESKKERLKTQIITDDVGNKIAIRFPEDVEVKESGNIRNLPFGNIKAGTFKPSSKTYEVTYEDENSFYDHPDILISTDTLSFDIDDYLKSEEDIQVIKRKDNRVYGYRVTYSKLNKEILCSFFILNYYKLKNSNIFVYYNTSYLPESYIHNKTDVADLIHSITENIEFLD